MIRLTKGPKPAILVRNEGAWTTELLTLRQNGSAVTDAVVRRYAHVEIKAGVIAESHGKCVYCESKVSHIAPGDIEHIKPKSKYPAETYLWENLAYVCNECNRRKGNNYDDVLPPVNPFVDEPSQYLAAVGNLIFSQLGKDRGELTVGLIELNRPPLLERRAERLSRLKNLAERCVRCDKPPLKRLLTEELSKEVGDDKEFAFVARNLLSALGLKVENPSK